MQRESVQSIADKAVTWVTADRVRVFGSAAAALLLVSLLCLVVGGLLVNLLAGLLAVVAAAAALVAVVTFAADRRGVTDGSDLWDHDHEPDSPPDEVFRGFSGFREYQ